MLFTSVNLNPSIAQELTKKNRKKEIKVFHCIYCKEKKNNQQKSTKQNENKKGELFKLTLSLE